MRILPLLVALLVGVTPASAADVAQCKTSPKLVGPCFVVHGRLSITNGYWTVRIWPVGTHRMLAVVDSTGYYDENTIALPPNVLKVLNGSGTDIFADYEVCPLTRSKPGHMQHICVVRASKISIRQP